MESSSSSSLTLWGSCSPSAQVAGGDGVVRAAGLALGARWLLDGPELSSEVRASASGAQLLGLFAPVCAAILLYEWFARPPAGLWRNLVVVAAASPTAYFLWRALLWLQFLFSWCHCWRVFFFS